MSKIGHFRGWDLGIVWISDHIGVPNGLKSWILTIFDQIPTMDLWFGWTDYAVIDRDLEIRRCHVPCSKVWYLVSNPTLSPRARGRV